MKLGIVVNDVDTEVPPAATTVMAFWAYKMGHTVYMMGVGELTYDSRHGVSGNARRPPDPGIDDQAVFLDALQGRDVERIRVAMRDLDILWLRYNPEEGERQWEQDGGIALGQLALEEGVIVLEHPYTLSYAVNKMYLEHFPADVRPRSIVTRDPQEVRRFYDELNGAIVLKPAHGYGGKDVYLLNGDATNLKQIVESIARRTYVIAQEFLTEAVHGDTRLFLMNGRPLTCDGKIAALRRLNDAGDFRSNMTAGGKPMKAEVTDRMLEIAELVRPRIVAAGLFLIGIDIVGDKVVEINPISAGGLNITSKLEGVPFSREVVKALERKVAYVRKVGPPFDNRVVATME